METPTLSLVLPLRDEASEVRDLETHLGSWLSAVELDCEIVLVDDGSTDDTRAQLEAWRARDARVKVIALLRSTTLEGALRAGLDHASGRAIVLLDGDVQDSAEVIPRLIEQWRAGHDLVHARRRTPKVHRTTRSWLTRAVHELTDSITQSGVPQDAGDFRLIDRALAERLQKLTPSARNLRGLLAHVAQRQAHVTFDSVPSKRNRRSLGHEVDAALDSITRQSLWPVRVAFLAATALLLVSVLALVVMGLIAMLVHDAHIRGWQWLSCIVGIVSSVQLFVMGLIGEYVGRMFRDVQHLPPYTLAATIGERSAPRAPELPTELRAPELAELRASEVDSVELAPPPPRTKTLELGAPIASTPPPAPAVEEAQPRTNTIKSMPPPAVAERPSAPPRARLTPPPGAVAALSESAKKSAAESKATSRPSNPPLPSRRSSIPPRLDKLGAPPSQRTKTLAGIPLPAMVDYTPRQSEAPLQKLSTESADTNKPAAESDPATAQNIERLKEEPKPLRTLHGVPDDDS